MYRKKTVNVLCIITNNLHPSVLDLFKILIKDSNNILQLWASRLCYNECVSVFMRTILQTWQHCFLCVCLCVTLLADTEDVCIVERLFSSSLVAIVSLKAPRKLKVCHFKKGTEICNYSYSNTILAVKLNRQVKKSLSTNTFFLLWMETVSDVIHCSADVVHVFLFRDW